MSGPFFFARRKFFILVPALRVTRRIEQDAFVPTHSVGTRVKSSGRK